MFLADGNLYAQPVLCHSPTSAGQFFLRRVMAHHEVRSRSIGTRTETPTEKRVTIV